MLDPKSSGKMGSRALVYYFATTIFAAIVGIIMVSLIHPGDPSIKEEVGTGTEDKKVSTLDAFLDLVRYGCCGNTPQVDKSMETERQKMASARQGRFTTAI